MENAVEMTERKASIEITADLANIRAVIACMVEEINKGPKSRARSLVVTKLEEASMWANEGLRTE